MRTRSRPVRGARSTAPTRFPDFFVVGHPKSGTTALYDMLRQHPQIFMSPIKEPRFFAANNDLRFPGARPMTEAEYLGLFAAAIPEQRLGEASPQYLASRTAAGQIAHVNHAAQIIAILREPASFVHSLHLHYVRRGLDRPADLREALASGPSHELWLHYAQRVRYVEQLERYRAVFPPEQLQVLIYDDYRRANVETLRLVFEFLGVDEQVEVAPREFRAAVGVRSHIAAAAWQNLMLGRSPAVGPLRRAVRIATPQVARDLVRASYRRVNLTAPPPVDEEVLAELRTRFAPEVRKASDYLGRDLCALWGYPESGS